MKLSDFDFELPNELIALRPTSPRHSAKLLVGKDTTIQHKQFFDLTDCLTQKDVLVFNNTKVIPAQLYGVRITRGEAAISATLHKQTTNNNWLAFVSGAKKLQQGDEVEFRNGNESINAKVARPHIDGEVEFIFDSNFLTKLEKIGKIPLPAYIANKRSEDEKDKTDYQTIYAKHKGAVAAPTAGLHFSDELFEKLATKKIKKYFLTLHVGAGTFLPVKAENIANHKMHSEIGRLSQATADELNNVRASGGRIIAVGTTCLRLLESAVNDNGRFEKFSGETDIFITPGYKFLAVDGLITNFHLPCSTLFMLVCAFVGMERAKKIYQQAIKNKYRFYSYGDGSLLFPN